MKYKVEFFSNWHCGSGQTAGADVDELVIKDAHHLPFIPGKTVKGLLRDAVTNVLHFTYGREETVEEIVEELFGSENCMSKLYFSNACLSPELTQTIKADKEVSPEMLYQSFSSTAIDNNGLAREHTLRRIETVVPCTLYGEIVGVRPEYEQVLLQALKYIKRVGLGRNRGLGRCKFDKVD